MVAEDNYLQSDASEGEYIAFFSGHDVFFAANQFICQITSRSTMRAGGCHPTVPLVELDPYEAKIADLGSVFVINENICLKVFTSNSQIG
jgi:hypothetical protein